VAVNHCDIAAPPERVFEILLDARYYGHWVVGARKIRGTDPDWPAVGSRFHHVVGVPPLVIRDHTSIEEIDPPRLLKLRAKARPLGTALIELRLEPNATGTRVRMSEEPGDFFSAFIFQPLTHLLVWRRNVTSLGRLKDIAEGRGPSPQEAAAA